MRHQELSVDLRWQFLFDRREYEVTAIGLSYVAEGHTKLLFYLGVVGVGESIKLGANDRDWKEHKVDLLLLHVFVTTPLRLHVLLHLFECFRVRLLKGLKGNLRLLSD